MRYINKGSTYIVQCSRDDITAFNYSWPCSSITIKPCFFEFDRNGLVDTNQKADGPEVLTLMEDCERYVANKEDNTHH